MHSLPHYHLSAPAEEYADAQPARLGLVHIVPSPAQILRSLLLSFQDTTHPMGFGKGGARWVGSREP